MGLSGLIVNEIRRKEPARLASATTRRTHCAVGAGVPLTTSRRRLALLADTQQQRPATTAGPPRPAGERLLAPAACVTCLESTGGSVTDSVRVPSPPRSAPRRQSKFRQTNVSSMM